MPVPPPSEEMLASMPMSRDEYEKLRPRGKLTLAKQKILNMIARITLHRGLRIWLYRQMGVNIGKDCVVEMFSYFDDQFPELIFMEDHSGISRYVIIIVHDDNLAKSALTPSGEHSYESLHGYVAPVRFKKYVGVAAGCIILPGVTVHEFGVIGAGAVVTKDVPSYTLVAGVPARFIKTYPHEDQVQESAPGPATTEAIAERNEP